MAKRRLKARQGYNAQSKGQVMLMGPKGPEPASVWDHGTGTRAAGFLTVTEGRGERDLKTGRMHNPNNVTGRRRRDIIEFYRDRGLITDRQFKAARLLRISWERTMRSPPAIKAVQVDTTPKPDEFISITLDRIGSYHKIAKTIPKNARPYIDHVVMGNRHIGSMPGYRRRVYMRRLCKGLDRMADLLGID